MKWEYKYYKETLLKEKRKVSIFYETSSKTSENVNETFGALVSLIIGNIMQLRFQLFPQ